MMHPAGPSHYRRVPLWLKLPKRHPQPSQPVESPAATGEPDSVMDRTSQPVESPAAVSEYDRAPDTTSLPLEAPAAMSADDGIIDTISQPVESPAAAGEHESAENTIGKPTEQAPCAPGAAATGGPAPGTANSCHREAGNGPATSSLVPRTPPMNVPPVPRQPIKLGQRLGLPRRPSFAMRDRVQTENAASASHAAVVTRGPAPISGIAATSKRKLSAGKVRQWSRK